MINSKTPIGVSFGAPQKALSNMPQNFTAVVKQQGEWWIGRIEEVPGVNCQERTSD